MLRQQAEAHKVYAACDKISLVPGHDLFSVSRKNFCPAHQGIGEYKQNREHRNDHGEKDKKNRKKIPFPHYAPS